MELNEGNTYTTQHDRGYIINIQMPDDYHYFHSRKLNLNDVVYERM